MAKFILVDDDPFHNLLLKLLLARIMPDVEAISFEDPQVALQFLKVEYKKSIKPTIILLDINMPGMTGWEFMDQFEKFDKELKDQFRVYILSSSVDKRDKDMAASNKYIRGFLSKPLEAEDFSLLST